MSDTPDIRQPAPITTDTFRSFVERAALLSLRGALSEEEAKRIAGQTALGFFTAMRTAKNPQDIVNCTRESILSAIATSVSTRGLKLIAKWLSQRPNASRGAHQIGTRPGGAVFRAPTHQSRSCA